MYACVYVCIFVCINLHTYTHKVSVGIHTHTRRSTQLHTHAHLYRSPTANLSENLAFSWASNLSVKATISSSDSRHSSKEFRIPVGNRKSQLSSPSFSSCRVDKVVKYGKRIARARTYT